MAEILPETHSTRPILNLRKQMLLTHEAQDTRMTDARSVYLPEELIKSRTPDESLWHCIHCGQVWYQSRFGHQRKLGKYDSMGSGVFVECSE
jgi:hypothetical protein